MAPQGNYTLLQSFCSSETFSEIIWRKLQINGICSDYNKIQTSGFRKSLCIRFTLESSRSSGFILPYHSSPNDFTKSVPIICTSYLSTLNAFVFYQNTETCRSSWLLFWVSGRITCPIGLLLNHASHKSHKRLWFIEHLLQIIILTGY